jgi:hypothetical protein
MSALHAVRQGETPSPRRKKSYGFELRRGLTTFADKLKAKQAEPNLVPDLGPTTAHNIGMGLPFVPSHALGSRNSAWPRHLQRIRSFFLL